jgi:hypothetical protein
MKTPAIPIGYGLITLPGILLIPMRSAPPHFPLELVMAAAAAEVVAEVVAEVDAS